MIAARIIIFITETRFQNFLRFIAKTIAIKKLQMFHVKHLQILSTLDGITVSA